MGLDELEAAWNVQADMQNQWQELDLDEIVAFAQEVERDRLRELVADDGYAMTFQSMGQYRSALLAALVPNACHQTPDE